MLIKVSKKLKKEDLEKALKKTSKRKKIDLTKYFGKVKFGMDGLSYQQSMRNEWGIIS